ncbi:hypothetical protein A9Q84_08840 [Halobacteriovorax marinus]|uniref:Porin domain-containing protein n=1 Tax=Halobacteriovorax marinus TaxID=97084 RepID=A0A1Y5FBV3_9BACT|nr:hypothetical protein A9Q84_08840 [Halobacteriovorax marinus]
MKKLLLGMLILPAMTANAAGLTPYILINKEYRSLSQEKTARMSKSTGITDVDGFETRLGAKASQELESGITASGKVELGINSSRDGANDDRIRIRLAQIDLAGSIGKVTIGQHWNPNTLKMLALDPFTATGAQLLGLESGDVVGATGGNFGMKARYFNDGLTYTSPKFAGIQASLTYDQSDDDDLNQDLDGNTEKWTTLVVSYGKTFGKSSLNVHVTRATGSVENTSVMTADNDEAFTTLGLKFSCPSFGASAAYTLDDKGQINTAATPTVATDIERKHLLAAVWYNMGMFTFGVNYGKTSFDDKENLGSSTDNKGGSQSQLGLGVIYKLAKNVKTRLLYRSQKIETKGTGTVAGTSKTNKANAIIAGATVSF